MSNIATTIEQSKHLIELDLPKETADMTWSASGNMLMVHTSSKRGTKEFPAWSLSALLEVMKEHCPELLFLEAYWYCRCMQVESEYCDDPITAVYDVLCWLLERGLIEKGGQQ